MVGGDNDAAFESGGLVFEQVDGVGFGEVAFEGVRGLADEGGTVGEEEGALDPPGAHEDIHQGDDGAGFAGARGHDEQTFAMAGLQTLKGFTDGFFLVVAVDDGFVGGDTRERVCLQKHDERAALDEPGEFVLGVEALDDAGWVVLVVPKPGGVAVGVEDEGPLPVHFFQTVGVEFGLLAALAGVAGGLFGFDEGQRAAIVSPEYVIYVAFPLAVGHPGDFVFGDVLALRVPARFAQEHVNQVFAGLSFGVGVGDVDAGVGDFGLGDLCLQGGGLGGVPGARLFLLTAGFVALVEFFIQGAELGGGLVFLYICRRNESFVKLSRDGVWVVAGVGTGEPVADLEEFTDGHQAIARGEGTGFVNGLVAELAEEVRFVLDICGGVAAERLSGEEGVQVVIIGSAVRGVVGVEPADGFLQGAAGVEAAGARVAVGVALGLGGGFVDGGPFGVEEDEVGHLV